MLDRFGLRGRTALVTGSSRGIGKAIVLCLAEAGADVIVHCASTIERAEAVAAQAREARVSAHAVQSDLGSEDGPRRLFEHSIMLLGRLDILVLNASTQILRPWSEITAEDFDRQMHVNLLSSMELMQLAIPGMIARRWGRVLTIGSIQQVQPHAQMLVYSASKAALVNMVMNVAKQVAPHGVTVNNLVPGVIDTDRTAKPLADAGYHERVLAGIPIGYVGQPDDCSGAALLLCSDSGRYITGADILVDGGMHL